MRTPFTFFVITITNIIYYFFHNGEMKLNEKYIYFGGKVGTSNFPLTLNLSSGAVFGGSNNLLYPIYNC